MFNETKEEKEFFEKQTVPPTTLKELKELSDRQLLERQTFYLMKMDKSNNTIKNNIQFWFYATIICAVLTIILLGSK